jgi:hypothetical protein
MPFGTIGRVISWPVFLGLAYGYVGLVVLGLVLSVTTRQQSRRRNIRIATAVLSAPALVVVAFLAFLRFVVFKEPPTLADLQHGFASKRADLKTIGHMSDEDLIFSRIAPTFLDRASDTPDERGRYTDDDPKAVLPEARWDAYRRIYARHGIKLGILRNCFT